jgi:hypothetical protein
MCGSVATRLLGLWVRIPLGLGCLSLVSVMCCQAGHSSKGVLLSVVCPTECDHDSLTMTRPWPTGGCCDMVKKIRRDIFGDLRFPLTGVNIYNFRALDCDTL